MVNNAVQGTKCITDGVCQIGRGFQIQRFQITGHDDRLGRRVLTDPIVDCFQLFAGFSQQDDRCAKAGIGFGCGCAQAVAGTGD